MDISRQVIGLAIEVHRQLGPGLPESAYQECLCQELRDASLPFDQQVALPIIYKGRRLDFEYKMDIVVEPGLVLEIKSVATLLPLHEAQLLTYLRLSGHRVGLLMNFNIQREARNLADIDHLAVMHAWSDTLSPSPIAKPYSAARRALGAASITPGCRRPGCARSNHRGRSDDDGVRRHTRCVDVVTCRATGSAAAAP